MKVQLMMLTLAAVSGGACSPSRFAADLKQAAGMLSPVPASSVSMKVINQASGSQVFSDTQGTSSFRAVAGNTYKLVLTGVNFPQNSTTQISILNTWLPNAVPTLINVTAADTIWTPAIAADYTIKLIIKQSNGSSLLSKSYSVSVACQTNTFAKTSLNSAGLLVTGSNNLYNFSAAAVITAANGQAPYQCAYDLTGVGILDTGFTDCSVPLTNQYVNYVQVRNVGVVVKDACNYSYSVSNLQTLTPPVPIAPGGNFITGNISAETGIALTDTRILGVHYVAQNVGGRNIVSPSYSGTGFTIQSDLTYGRPSSVNFGMRIVVAGIAGTFDLRNNVFGVIDTSHAIIQGIAYSTDQAGDQSPVINLSSQTCTTTGIHALPHNVVGVPCASGTTGSQNHADVEVWGDYSCTNVNGNGATVTINGTFDGLATLTDSCIGGGGGGGGIVPIHL